MIDYSKVLSEKVANLKPSGIRKFFDLAAEIEDVIALTIGEPNFKTPWHIREAGIDSLKKAAPGIPQTQVLPNFVPKPPNILSADSTLITIPKIFL